MTDTITVESLDDSISVTIEEGDEITLTLENTESEVAGAVVSVNGKDGDVVLTQDDIGDGTTYKRYSQTEKTKLSGIETGAEVNNISDVNATDLTDGGATTLHKHSYNNLDDKPTIPDQLSDLSDDTTHRTVTDTEKSTWNGKSDLALGELSSNAYRGDRGKAAYDHSQAAHAPSDAEKNVQPDWNEADSGADAFIKNKPTIPGTTDSLIEGSTNKYFTESRVRDTVLTGFTAALSRTAILATDKILEAFGKIQKYLSDLGDAAFKNTGTTAGTLCAGDDSRLSDGRTDANAIHKTTAAEIAGLSGKTTLVDGDVFLIEDSETTPTRYGKKWTLLSNIKSFLKTYFDTIYSAIGHNHTGVYKAVGADETANVSSASDTVAGKVELATIAETNAGTDTGRAVTPDGLSGSLFGQKAVSVQVVDGATAVATGDGKCYFRIPAALNGMNLISANAQVIVKSTSGTPTVQLARGRQANATSDFTYTDMLSTRITIDENEYDSKDATTAAAIDTNNDDVATGDVIRIDVDTAGTGTKGLNITLTFQLP